MHTVVGFFAILSKNHASTQTSHAFMFGKPLLFTSPEKKYLPRQRKNGDLFVFVKSDMFFRR
jgi:hypothetical protein